MAIAEYRVDRAPAPYLAQAPAPKLGVGVVLNRCRDRASCLLGPDTVRAYSVPISPRSGPDPNDARLDASNQL